MVFSSVMFISFLLAAAYTVTPVLTSAFLAILVLIVVLALISVFVSVGFAGNLARRVARFMAGTRTENAIPSQHVSSS